MTSMEQGSEVILSCWIVLDDQGDVQELRMQHYTVSGDEFDKMVWLQAHCQSDCLAAPTVPIPERFRAKMVTRQDVDKFRSTLPYETLPHLGGFAALFEEGIRELKAELLRDGLVLPVRPLVGRVLICDQSDGAPRVLLFNAIRVA